MKNIARYIVFFLVCFVGGQALNAQKNIKKGDNLYEKGEFYQALKAYDKAEEAGENITTSVKKKIGNCYFQLNDLNKAYQEFEPIAHELTGTDVLTFAMIYHQFPFYTEAIDWYKKAKNEGADPNKVNKLIEACEWASENQDIDFNIRVNPTTIYTGGQSFGIEYYKDGVVYSSVDQSADNKVDKTGKAFLDLYYSDLKNEEIQEGKLLSEKLQFPYHVGAISFTSDFNTMYFTLSVRVKGDSRLKIYKVTYDGGDWSKEVELPINSEDYDCVHPAVSPDDKFLYFVSNKKGGIGGKDIYRVERLRGGMYGKARNLGPEINSSEDEQFPYLSKDGELFFSSDGRLGYGGLDIFKAEMVNGKWVNPVNMLRPFNSEKDDFAYSINPKNPQRGFLSSNRSGNGDQDVIFYVDIQKEEKDEPKVGDVIDITTLPVEEPVVKEPVVDLSKFPSSLSAKIKSTFNNDAASGINVQIIDDVTGAVIASGVSNANGNVSVEIPDEYKKEGQEFEIMFSKEGEYNSKRMIVNIMEINDINDKGISLTPIFNDEVLDDISGMTLYYNGTELLEESKKTLERLATYLQKNPQIVVKLNTHSDARGSKLDNLRKSQTMGEKVENMLQVKGVDGNATIPRGYGERYLVNKCKRGVLCSEEEQQKNKRIEVVVWRVNK
ncbi:OmpA family protein [Labilibacter marinus]|uniref:OmpA family protein n=1 Tax=Labilibacter marinus TaxID=1477105 RepID=UPI0009F8D3A5|nr:OmpA family protein [Labilibacter marinus]